MAGTMPVVEFWFNLLINKYIYPNLEVFNQLSVGWETVLTVVSPTNVVFRSSNDEVELVC
ncbi:hypothetical protein LG200_05300 [Methylobacillus caricis]|uniref:hypothetical protein n=1 Tax=Methylobacillus caricis TaxID=1971611 RepID=UPI001CFFAF04|nr:hypothetical protein [Methylobacillus caricis]MCB5187420.1 hypothetical protein [Methylobacillus caricis]